MLYIISKREIIHIRTLVILFRQTEIVLKDSTAFVYVTKSEKSSNVKDSTAFVYVTKSEKSSHLTLMT